jgi:ferric-chelate reductase (NADPH)
MSAIKKTILSVVGNRLFETGRIAEVNEVSPNFRLIDIEADLFKEATFQPGQKIQVNTGNWELRTYTPLSINPEMGRLGVLAYIHGKGPGSSWAANTRPGDSVQFFGPHRSIKLAEPERPLVLFGDETAIAVATNFKRRLKEKQPLKLVFEASAPDEVQAIVRDIGLTDVTVVPKAPDGLVSIEALRAVVDAASKPCHLILTGRAQSIQQVRGRLKSFGFPMGQITSKAYWSEGSTGLD